MTEIHRYSVSARSVSGATHCLPRAIAGLHRETPKYKAHRAKTAKRPAATRRAANREIGSPRGVGDTFEGCWSGLKAHVERASPRY